MSDTMPTPLSPLDHELLAAAAAALSRAHAPYSRFSVGAAVRGADGTVFAGCNVENASYPEGWCAETSALAALVLAGQQPFSTAAVVVRATTPCAPCGGCRQRLAELATDDARVLLAILPLENTGVPENSGPHQDRTDAEGGSPERGTTPFACVRHLTLRQLLPEHFSSLQLPSASSPDP